MVNVNLDYAAPDALYASTCQGLYAWNRELAAWEQRSDRLTDVVAVAYGEPDTLWAAAHGDGVIRSGDGGRTWQDASDGLVTFGGMANLGIDPRDNNTLYGIIRPQYAGSYLRRGMADGSWVTMPTPQDNATIATGMAIDGGSGALYVTTQLAPVGLWRSHNPDAPMDDVQWELLHDFGPNVQASLGLRLGTAGAGALRQPVAADAARRGGAASAAQCSTVRWTAGRPGSRATP